MPYWNDYTQQLSQQLSLNIATDSVASNLSWSSGASEKLTKETWFHVKCTKIVPTMETAASRSIPATLLREIMDDARRTTDAREGLLQEQQDKNRSRKLNMNQAGKEATAKRQKTKEEEKEKAEAALQHKQHKTKGTKRKNPSDAGPPPSPSIEETRYSV